jgi:hypothetical protein
MSIALMTDAWKLTGLSSTQKLVLLSLADNANDQGECYPSVRQMVERTCLSERAVRDAIRSLETIGYVRSLPRVGTSTVYVLELSQKDAQTPAAAAPPAPNAGGRQLPPGGAGDAPPPRQQLPPRGAARAPKPSLNRQLNRQLTVNTRKKPGAEIAEMDLPDWMPRKTWAEWVEHRRAVGAALTERAAELSLKKLDKFRAAGHDPVSIIEASVFSGKWTDLYAPKPEARASPAPGMTPREAENARRKQGFRARIGARQTDDNTIDMETIDATC